jgi:catechol 2,3-dioxygenase-like lactoylglutathione lyase family enzyme
MRPSHALIAILPCNDLDASEAFYHRLGFTRPESEKPAKGDYSYRMLSDGKGGHLHLTDAVEGWLVPGRNPFGLYFYTEDVDALAAEFAGETVEKHGPHLDSEADIGHLRHHEKPCDLRWRISS